MRVKQLIIVLSFLSFFISNCKEDRLEPIEKDGTAPAPVTNVTVESIGGGARISYSLPKEDDLLYVLATYKLDNNKSREFKSSFYTNNVVVEGFSDTEMHDVELYCVDKSGNRSSAVHVNVQPLTPPVIESLESLVVVPDFGGINIRFKNSSKADLAIHVVTPDSTGKMAIANTFYTARDSGFFSVRGFKSEPRKFGIYIVDKWSNFSPTKEIELTPIYEIMMDKSKFREVVLPGDSPTNNFDGAMRNIWDGKVLPDGPNCAAHTGIASTGSPKYFTFDMGAAAQLSRFSLQAVADDKHWFNDVTPKRYEIWGTLSPDPGGSFNGWTKLLTITSVKPSGLPTGILTEDDRVAGRIGDEANVPLDLPKVRYIRIRCLENWSGNTNMAISEVTFWGNDK